jgi:hypothetical protein
VISLRIELSTESTCQGERVHDYYFIQEFLIGSVRPEQEIYQSLVINFKHKIIQIQTYHSKLGMVDLIDSKRDTKFIAKV